VFSEPPQLMKISAGVLHNLKINKQIKQLIGLTSLVWHSVFHDRERLLIFAVAL